MIIANGGGLPKPEEEPTLPLVPPTPDTTIPREETPRHIPEEYRAGVTEQVGWAPPPKPIGVGIAIPMAQAELEAVAAYNAKATCPGEMQTVGVYAVSGWDENHNWVKITVQEVDEKSAKQKASDAGYDVKWVTRQIGVTTKEKAKGEAITFEDGSVGYGVETIDGLSAYEVTDQAGNKAIYVSIKDEMGGSPVFVPKENWDNLFQKYKDAAKTTGWRAMDTAIRMDEQSSRSQFESSLATMPDYLKEAYKTGGIEGYNKAVDEWNTMIDWVEQHKYEMWPQGYPEEQKNIIRQQDAPEIYDLWAKMNKPSDMPAEEYSKIVPYLSPCLGGAGDLTGAIKARVADSTITRVMGLEQQALDEAKWQVEFGDAGFFQQQKMLIDKDPVEYVKTMGKAIGEAAITMIPVYGTAYMAARPDKYRAWEVGLGGASDVLVLVAGVGLVSKLVKAGSTIPRAVARVGFEIARGTVLTPWSVLRHPVQTAKGLGMLVVSPLEMIFKAKTLPVASVWRGTYEDGFSIAKVLAGSPEEALETQKAMAKQFALLSEGKATSGAVEIKGFGELRFSGTGLQTEMPNIIYHATPFGAMFKGAGVQIGKQGLYTADQALLGLDQGSATGQSMIYVFRKKELLGMIDDAGKFLDTAGVQRGQLRIGEKLIDLKGNAIFQVGDAGQVLDRGGTMVGQLKAGGVWADDLKLIGKYYAGVYEQVGDGVGIITKTGAIQDVATGKILGSAKPKLIGYIPEGAKVVGAGDVVIGKTKLQPAFVLIYTQGVSELPAATAKAKNMKELETMAWAAFRNSDATEELYPVFKQYAKWIEDEGYLTGGSRMIPVLDKNGKPLMLATRDIGRKIEMPVMQLVTKDWFEQSLAITKAITKYPVLLDDSVDVVKILQAGVTKVPKKAIPGIVSWLRQTKGAVLIGGGSEVVFTKGKLTTADFDIAVPKPTKAMGDELALIIHNLAGKQTRAMKTAKGIIVEWLDKGLWRKAVDIDDIQWIKEKPPLGLAEFDSMRVGGINVQTPASQITRLFWFRMADDFGGKGYAKWAQYARALGADVDIGIGAVAPSTSSLRKLQIRGLWNTLRDIFVPTLEKVKRLDAVENIAPDLADDVRRLITAEDRVIDLMNRVRNAERIRTAASSTQLMRLLPALQSAQDTVNRLTVELQDSLMRRALVIYNTATKVSDIQRQRQLLEQTYRAMQGRPVRVEDRVVTSERIPASERLRRERIKPETVSQRQLRIKRGEREKIPQVQREYMDREERLRVQKFDRYQRYERHERRPRYPRYPRYRKEEKTTITLERETKKGPLVPQGSIAWRQGSRLVKGELRPQWYYIPPPWTQETPISLDYAPLGAKNTEETTPKKTIQMIGETKAKVPKSVSIDLGVVDVFITDYGRSIKFTGHGEETKVGMSLNIPTRGMSIPAIAPMRVAKLKKRGNGHKKVASSRTVMVG